MADLLIADGTARGHGPVARVEQDQTVLATEHFGQYVLDQPFDAGVAGVFVQQDQLRLGVEAEVLGESLVDSLEVVRGVRQGLPRRVGVPVDPDPREYVADTRSGLSPPRHAFGSRPLPIVLVLRRGGSRRGCRGREGEREREDGGTQTMRTGRQCSRRRRAARAAVNLEDQLLETEHNPPEQSKALTSKRCASPRTIGK